MKKIIFSLVLILASFGAFAQQNVGDVSNIKLKNSSGTKDDVWRTGHAQNTYDTAVAVWLSPLKLKTDSIYTKLMSGLAVTGTFYQATQPVSLDSATQRKTIKVSELPAIAITNTTFAVTNAGTFAVQVDSSLQRKTIKVSELPAITGTVTASVDSNSQRKTIKVSELPSITIANTGFTANAGTNLNTSLLALASKQPSIGPAGSPSTDVLSIQGVSGMTPVKVDGSAVTQPISAASLPLPSGAATAAKQPALGVAGTPSADVITIQGDTGMRPVKIDGSAVTQPVSIATPPKTVIYDSTVTATAMTITNLSALASSATAGWQSAKVSNLTAMASDYKITVRVSMANTPPANDKSIYVYAVPWGTTDGGTTWYSATGGTTTSPSGSEGTYTIVSAAPTNFRLLGILNYQTQDMNPCDNFLLSNAFGNVIPDAWSLVIVNYSGAALETTSGANNLVYYSPVYKTQR